MTYMNKLNYCIQKRRLNIGLLSQQRSHSKYFNLENTPFENVKSNKKEHADVNDLNNMYSSMFYSQESSKDKKIAETEVNDLDSINKEINEFFGTPSPEAFYRQKVNVEEIDSIQKFIDLVMSDSKFCIVSKSTDPFYNLAMEDFIFRNTPIVKSNLASPFNSQRLMLYVNEKTCVFGKNQNPFKEVNLKSELLKKNGGVYNLVRRYSGGGTVVHDTGNVNYSYLTSRNEFDQKFFNSFIVNLVNKHLSSTQEPILDLPIDMKKSQKNYLSLNDRGDITCNGYKVSGSAFKIALNKSYHHGTMLIDSNLKEFSKIMRPKLKNNEETNNGIKHDMEEFSEETDVNSVRSPIENLKKLTGEALSTPQHFIQILVSGFKTLFLHSGNIKTYSISPEKVNFIDVYEACRDQNLKNTSKGFIELPTEGWIYRHTPSFKYTNKSNGFYYRVKKGVVVDTNDTQNNIELNKTLFKEDFMV